MGNGENGGMNNRAKIWTASGLVASVIAGLTILNLVWRPIKIYGQDTNRLVACESNIKTNDSEIRSNAVEIRRVEKEARACRDAMAKDLVEMKRAQSRVEAMVETVLVSQAEGRRDIKELLSRVR